MSYYSTLHYIQKEEEEGVVAVRLEYSTNFVGAGRLCGRPNRAMRPRIAEVRGLHVHTNPQATGEEAYFSFLLFLGRGGGGGSQVSR